MSQNESTQATKNRNELKGDQKRAKTALNKPKRAKRCPKTTQNYSKQPKRGPKMSQNNELYQTTQRAKTSQNNSK